MSEWDDGVEELEKRPSERFLVLFSLLDYLFAAVPLIVLSIGCVVGAVISIVVYPPYAIIFGPIAWLLVWITSGVCRGIMSRRDPKVARKYRERLGITFRFLAVITVLGNMLVIPTLGIEAFLWMTLLTAGFVYASIRHLLLIYLDEKREALGGVPLDDSSPDL